jgi:hypothetical protein
MIEMLVMGDGERGGKKKKGREGRKTRGKALIELLKRTWRLTEHQDVLSVKGRKE